MKRFHQLPRVLGIVLAGGKGERLYPLTRERTKPAIPFGSKYRIVDFVLSNFVNSGILSIYVMVQYLSQSLIEYLRMSWRAGGLIQDHFITVVPPQMRVGEMWYRGTADAVRQNLNLIQDFDPEVVAVFGADHIYRIDVGQMLEYHLDRDADVTVAALPVPISKASGFGIIAADSKGRVVGFEEKPQHPKPMPGNPHYAYSSMGNYIFRRSALLKILERVRSVSGELDFGKTILPWAHRFFRICAYNFKENELPGLHPYEERGYWRDVGDLKTFWSAHMDLLGPKPRLDLNNFRWPIYSGRYQGPSAKILDGDVQNSILGDGCVVENSKIRRCVLGRGVTVRSGAVLEDSILMDFSEVGPHGRLRKTIVDRFNVLPARSSVGMDPEKDARSFFLDDSGIAVVPRGKTKR